MGGVGGLRERERGRQGMGMGGSYGWDEGGEA